MRHRQFGVVGKVVLIGLLGWGAWPLAGKPLAEDKTGIAVGQAAPPFTLKDQNGQERSLAELLADGPVALVFFRSAAWCPICMKQLAELNRDREKIEAAGARLVAISYDDVASLKQYADRAKIGYPLLSDPGSQTIAAYGILRHDVKSGSREEGVPYPGVYLVDQQGTVRAKFFEEGYIQRVRHDDLIQAAQELATAK